MSLPLSEQAAYAVKTGLYPSHRMARRWKHGGGIKHNSGPQIQIAVKSSHFSFVGLSSKGQDDRFLDTQVSLQSV